jgi:hypothetical protein
VKLTTFQALTGSAPVPIDDSIAGLTHLWTLKTAYYTTDLNIWIDDISELSTWSAEFSKDEAKEVIEAVGAWLYVFRKPVTDDDVNEIKSTISAVKAVIAKATGDYWEGTCLAVGTKQSTTTSLRLEGEEWEEFCQEHSFEYIDAEAKGRNEFGEPVGVERIREALETTDWENDVAPLFGGDDFEGDDDFGDDADWGGLAGEQAEMNAELLGMKTALNGGAFEQQDEEAQVEEMGRMMSRLMAIKGASHSVVQSSI